MSGKLFGRGGEIFSYTRETTVEECAQLVRRAAMPAEIGERTGTQIERAALRLEWTPNQVKKVWYRERRALLNHEVEYLRWRVAQLETRRGRRAELRRDTESLFAELLRKPAERNAGPLGGEAGASRLDES